MEHEALTAGLDLIEAAIRQDERNQIERCLRAAANRIEQRLGTRSRVLDDVAELIRTGVYSCGGVVDDQNREYFGEEYAR